MSRQTNEPEGLASEKGMVRRFSRRQRLEHLVIVILFTLLVLTGLPQKFWNEPWAGTMVRLVGSLDLMRLIHRMSGLAFAAFTLYFIVTASIDILRGRMAPSMVPFWTDLKEVSDSLKWGLGVGKRPLAGRFDFREKVEFWGMLFGGMVMVITGLILYFPIWFTHWLPGEFVPAAKEAHSNEAMLALMVIVCWHLYNSLFRPSVFPLDGAMIHGRISLERLKEEHTLEYERLASRAESTEQEEK